MPNWKQADTAETAEPSADQLELAQLRAQIERSTPIVRRLEHEILPGLEKELAEIEATAPPPPPRVTTDENTGVLNTSVMIEVLTDVGPSGDAVPAGSIITTLQGAAFEELKARNPQRKVVRVSLDTIRERKAAGHVAK